MSLLAACSRSALATLLLVSLAACQTVELENRILPYDRGDVVVTGRIVNGDYSPIVSESDILGHGIIDARIVVRDVIVGDEPRRTIPLSYVAHVEIREDKSFMFVLRRREESYSLVTAQLLEFKPSPTDTCST